VWPDSLSSLEKLGYPRTSPRVTLLFSGRQTVGSHSNKGNNCIILLLRLTLRGKTCLPVYMDILL
jgi:hypothetical protein